jgi:hypothetical protein
LASLGRCTFASDAVLRVLGAIFVLITSRASIQQFRIGECTDVPKGILSSVQKPVRRSQFRVWEIRRECIHAD